jgi:hypothetical protein
VNTDLAAIPKDRPVILYARGAPVGQRLAPKSQLTVTMGQRGTGQRSGVWTLKDGFFPDDDDVADFRPVNVFVGWAEIPDPEARASLLTPEQHAALKPPPR